jgi:hypothetical protein
VATWNQTIGWRCQTRSHSWSFQVGKYEISEQFLRLGQKLEPPHARSGHGAESLIDVRRWSQRLYGVYEIAQVFGHKLSILELVLSFQSNIHILLTSFVSEQCICFRSFSSCQPLGLFNHPPLHPNFAWRSVKLLPLVHLVLKQAIGKHVQIFWATLYCLCLGSMPLIRRLGAIALDSKEGRHIVWFRVRIYLRMSLQQLIRIFRGIYSHDIH